MSTAQMSSGFMKPLQIIVGEQSTSFSPTRIEMLPSFAAAADAGNVTMLVGRGTALSPDGNVRALSNGDPVFAGELVNTGTNRFRNIKFRDGGLVPLRPNSRSETTEHRHAGHAPAPP